MKGRALAWSAEELAWIEMLSALPRRDLHRKFQAAFDRPDVSLGALNALCKRNGWMTGRTGCFRRGGTPANKGKPMPYHPNSAATRFKPGQLPHNTKFLGHERVSKDGYVEISIADTNPHTGYERRYVLKHRNLWEAIHGPVPDGMMLKCLNGDKTNTDPGNWELLSRGVLPRLNGGRHKKYLAYDTAPAELKPTILAVAKLDHRARALKRIRKTNV